MADATVTKDTTNSHQTISVYTINLTNTNSNSGRIPCGTAYAARMVVTGFTTSTAVPTHLNWQTTVRGGTQRFRWNEPSGTALAVTPAQVNATLALNEVGWINLRHTCADSIYIVASDGTTYDMTVTVEVFFPNGNF